MISAFELYLSDKDEIEFLDTLAYIISIQQNKHESDNRDDSADKEFSSSSHHSKLSSIHKSGDEAFEIFSVCTLANGDSVSDGNKTLGDSKATPGFQKTRNDSIDNLESKEYQSKKQIHSTSEFQALSQIAEKSKHSQLLIPEAIREAKAKDESSPQNGSFNHIENSEEKFNNQPPVFETNKVEEQELSDQGQNGFSSGGFLSAPIAKKIDPGLFSFYKKPPPQDSNTDKQPNYQLDNPSTNIQLDAPKDDKMSSNPNDFSGFCFNDDANDKNSVAASGNFGVLNQKRRPDESLKNSVGETGCFVPIPRNLSDNFDKGHLPQLQTVDSIVKEQPDPDPPKVSIQYDHRAIALGNMSFNPSGLRALMGMQKQTPIVEQKIESETQESPIRPESKDVIPSVSEAALDSPTKDGLPLPKNFNTDQIVSEGSPDRNKGFIDTPLNSQQMRAYIAQILRFVMQHDGADPKLAKLFSDVVTTAETGASSMKSFPSDMFKFAKNKFMKSLDNYIQPILVEAIIERGDKFNGPLNRYNKDGDMEGLVRDLITMSEGNEDIINEGAKIKEVRRYNIRVSQGPCMRMPTEIGFLCRKKRGS